MCSIVPIRAGMKLVGAAVPRRVAFSGLRSMLFSIGGGQTGAAPRGPVFTDAESSSA